LLAAGLRGAAGFFAATGFASAAAALVAAAFRAEALAAEEPFTGIAIGAIFETGRDLLDNH
jgi:hypothetical protein